MGSARTPSHTDVLAAEAARKQALTLFLPLLTLFFFLFCLLFLFFSPLALSLSSHVFCSSFCSPPFARSASHLDDYSKLKGMEKL